MTVFSMYSKTFVSRSRSSRLANRKRRLFHIELLEHRTLMAADFGASTNSTNGLMTRQLMASPDEYFQKSAISKELIAVVDSSVAGNGMSDYLMYDELGRIDVHFSGEDVAAVVAKAAELGFEPLHVDLARRTVDGFLSVGSIANLKTALTGMSVGVTPNYRPQTSVGAVTSEADTVLQSARLRQLLPAGYDGAGVRIGVLSDSYNNLNGAAADIASGDLPTGIQVIQDLGSGGSDEGRAMLQLIHDVAPAATLGFATAFIGGQAGFAANINALATTFNADVITDDVFYFAEPYFQDGIIAQAINNVVQNSDVAYFSSAGNLSDQAYERSGPFTTGSVTFGAANFGVSSVTISTALDLDPGAGTDFRQSITLNNNQRALIGLQWDSPFFASVNTDLDIYLVDQLTNQLVALAASDAIASDEPVDIFSFTNTTGAARTYEIIIDHFSGPNPGRIKWVNFGANNSGPINTIEYDTNSPTITPHSAAEGAMSVGAAPYFNQKTPESFTSIGPATFLFAANGTPIPETVRAKPDMTATDGANNTFFGGDAEGDGRPNFFGTSAAAPHAAAVAAIVRQANPGFDAAAVYARMKQTAIDIAAPGADNVTGVGLVNAFTAVFPTVATPGLPVTEDFSSGMSNRWEVSTNVNGRARVLSLANDGNNQLVMDTFFSASGLNSLNEAVLHFDATGVPDIELSFDQREYADEDNPMPATFTGSNPSDGVALSVDGTNWFRLISLTGTNSTSTFTTRKFNLSQFALANGLTLGNHVRIKFQQFDNAPIVADGMAFDNISVAKAPNVAPVFGQASYAFSLAETATSGAPVGGVSATDANLGDVLTYSLSGTGASNFVINPSSGAITVSPTASFNAVLTPIYNLTASVSDGTVSVTAPITVNMTAVVAVASTNVFYKGSAFAAAGVAAGIDSSKQLGKPGSTAVSLNYTNLLNTTLGINGLVLDIARMPGSTLTAADFVFRMSPQGLFNEATNPPSSWAAAPAPTGIFVTPASATTPARVRLEWANNAIANRWLQLQVLNSANTGLAATQVYYIGHLQGELDANVSISNAYFVNNADLSLINPIGGVAAINNPRDVDKNRFILNADGVAIRNSVNAGRSLRNLTMPPAGSAEEGSVTLPPGSGSGWGSQLAPPITLGTGLDTKTETRNSPSRSVQARTGATLPTTALPTGNTLASAASLSIINTKPAARTVDAVFSEFESLEPALKN